MEQIVFRSKIARAAALAWGMHLNWRTEIHRA